MSENLGRVCEDFKVSENLDIVCVWAMEWAKLRNEDYIRTIHALRAEFAELERKAGVLNTVRAAASHTVKVLAIERVMLKASEYDRGGEAMCKSIVQLIDSLAKGGRDDQG